MAQVTGTATYWNSPNYDGLLWTADVEPGQGTGTPFLTIMGGLNGGNARIAPDFDYAMTSEYDYAAAAQPSITETASLTAPSATSPVLAQSRNTAQIFQEAVDVSYKKQSTNGRIATDIVESSVGYWAQDGSNNQSPSLFDQNIAYVLRKIARDANYTFLNGTFAQSTGSGVAAQTGGVISGVTTTAIAAAAAAISKPLLQQLFKESAENSGGRVFTQTPILLMNAFQKQSVSDLYANQPESFNVGGVNIQTILSDFGQVGVVYDPMVPTDTILLTSMAANRPVFVPVPGKGNLFFEELSRTGASQKGQVYGQMGIDYSNEKLHGKITGLATS